MRVALVLVSYATNVPAGIERSLAAIEAGLTDLGHEVHFLAAGPRRSSDGSNVTRLRSLTLDPVGATSDDRLLAMLQTDDGVRRETAKVIKDLDIDAAIWADSVWGLGYLGRQGSPISVLMAHVLRRDEWMGRALAAGHDAVVVPSDIVIKQAAEAGLDTRLWETLPNGLLPRTSSPQRTNERLRTVRILARLEPQKGVAEALSAVPSGYRWPVEVVLARAGFEYWEGMQSEVLRSCEAAAAGKRVTISSRALDWEEVPEYLAAAGVVVIPSVEPETFGLVALESMAVGTPVVAFDHGNIPDLIGDAGVVVPMTDGAEALWRQADRLLSDAKTQATMSTCGLDRAARFSPARVAQQWEDLLGRLNRHA